MQKKKNTSELMSSQIELETPDLYIFFNKNCYHGKCSIHFCLSRMEELKARIAFPEVWYNTEKNDTLHISKLEATVKVLNKEVD